jgi:hypothetical protein
MSSSAVTSDAVVTSELLGIQPSGASVSQARNERLELHLDDYLKLNCTISFDSEHILFCQFGAEFVYQNEGRLGQTLPSLFRRMDGCHTWGEIQCMVRAMSQAEAILGMIDTLIQQGLIDTVSPLERQVVMHRGTRLGRGATFDLHQQVEKGIGDRLILSSLWQALQPGATTHPHLFYGLALELHHFLANRSAFQAPLLDFQASAPIRRALTQLHQQELGLDAGISRALGAISTQISTDHLPLPETVSLLNGLAFWAQTEPLFMLSLQGVLSQSLAQLLEQYGSACEAQMLEPGFIAAIQSCVFESDSCHRIPLEMLCAEAWRSQPETIQQRHAGQAHLFVELYCNWLEAIAIYDSAAPQIQRSVAEIVGERVSAERPRLKDGLVVEYTAVGVEMREGQQGIAIAVPPEDQPETQQLLRCLQAGGFSRQDLAEACPTLEGQIVPLLDAFEAKGWLMTAPGDRPLSGRQFSRELSRFLARLKQQFPPSRMAEQMMAGSITRSQLVGYVLESYHVTHLCPRLLAPALCQFESAPTQALLQDFFTSELKHDQLVENSLKSVGITSAQIHTMQPLPMTFAVCSTLGVLARRHPLSFKSALVLFEEDDKAFHQLFKQCCENLGLPAAFYKPILLHAHINEDGEHEQITEMLLDEVAYISIEEQQLVKQNLTTLLTSMVLRTHEIMDYYGDPSNRVPRCFGLPEST